jgi:hypothetical protein
MNAAPPRDMHHISHASGAKAKGKEPESPPLSGTQPDIVFDEGHFELIMGLFEKWTDEIVSPYLHLVRACSDICGVSETFCRIYSPITFPSLTTTRTISQSLCLLQYLQILKSLQTFPIRQRWFSSPKPSIHGGGNVECNEMVNELSLNSMCVLFLFLCNFRAFTDRAYAGFDS